MAGQSILVASTPHLYKTHTHTLVNFMGKLKGPSPLDLVAPYWFKHGINIALPPFPPLKIFS